MTKNKMTPAERVKAAMAGNDFDVYPVITPLTIATIDAMEKARAFYPSVYFNAMEMAALAEMGHDYFGFDSVSPYFSIHQEASALGAEIDWKNDYSMPDVVKRPFNSLDDVEIPQTFLHKTEFQNILKACEIVHSKYKGRVPVIGKVVGPWTLLFLLYGVENLVLDTILEPEKLKKILSEIAVIPIKFAEAQFNAGADMVFWVDLIDSINVSAEIYREFLLPVQKKAAQQLQNMGPMILGIPNNIMDRFDSIIKTGFKIFYMSSKNDIASIVKKAKSAITITGCINVPNVLCQGSPEMIRQEVESIIKTGIRLIAPEHVLPVTVPTENIKYLVESAHRMEPQ